MARRRGDLPCTPADDATMVAYGADGPASGEAASCCCPRRPGAFWVTLTCALKGSGLLPTRGFPRKCLRCTSRACRLRRYRATRTRACSPTGTTATVENGAPLRRGRRAIIWFHTSHLSPYRSGSATRGASEGRGSASMQTATLPGSLGGSACLQHSATSDHLIDRPATRRARRARVPAELGKLIGSGPRMTPPGSGVPRR